MSTSLPIISISILLLLLAAIVVRRAKSSGFEIAMGACLAILGLSVYGLLMVNANPETIHLEESIRFGFFSWHAGLDGFSILFLLLAAILAPLLLLYIHSIHSNQDPVRTRSIITGLLLYQAILIGAIGSLNLFQFWCFLLLELIPLRILSVKIVNEQRKLGSVIARYWTMMLIMVLTAILFIVIGNTDANVPVLDHSFLNVAASMDTASLIFILLFFGLAVRMPVFPFHGWLPELVNSNKLVPVFCIIAGVKISFYGMYRFVLPLQSAGDAHWAGLITVIALFCIFYGALLALMQININRLLAFAVISHNGMLVAGLFTGNSHSLQGSMLLSIAFGLASAGMILSSAFIHRKTGTSFIPRLGNQLDHNTAAALLFLLSALSTMAMPGTPGYNAAHLLLEGVIETNGWQIAVAILIGNVLAAAFLFRAFQQIFIATSKRTMKPKGGITLKAELLISILLCLLLIITGFYPLANWLEGAL